MKQAVKDAKALKKFNKEKNGVYERLAEKRRRGEPFASAKIGHSALTRIMIPRG